MAEEINEWELAQDFTPQEDIKKKNTEKSSSEFRAGFIKPSPSGSDGLGTSEIDTWESTLSDEQKKDVVPVKPKAQQPVKKKDLSEFLPKLNEAVPSTTATKVEVQPVSEGRDIKVKTALNDVAMRISKDSPIVQQKDALEADLLSSKDIIDELTQAYEQEQDINKKQEIGLKLNDLVQNFNSKLPEYQKIEDSLKNDYALYSSLNKGYEAIKKLPELQKELEDYKKRKDDPVGNFVAGLYNTAVPATLKAVGSLVNLTGDLGASYTASLGDPTAIAEEMYGGDKDKVTDNIDKALRGLADDIEIKLPDEIKQLTSYNLGAGAGSTLSILGTSLIGGAPAGVATGFGLSFDSIKEEALNKGYTEKEANLISSLISLPVAALDQIGIAPLIEKYGANKISNALFKRVSTELAGKEITKETISKSISKGISDIVMDKTLMLAKEGGTEFVTEFAQSGLESLGKATADVIKGEDKFDIKPKQAFKDALTEGAYGFGSTGIIGTPGAVYQGVSEIFSDDKTLYSEIKKLAQDEDYYNRFEKQLEVDVKLGKKTQEDVDNILDNIKAVAEIESKLPSNVTSDNKRIQAISLVRQKQDLQKQLETADENFKPAVESKIRDTQETINKITTGQALTDEDVLNSEYSVQKDKNGIPVFYKKFDGDTYEVTRDIFEKELNQKNKLLKDAAKIEEKQTNEIERKVTDEQLGEATSIKRKPSTTEQSKTEEQAQEQELVKAVEDLIGVVPEKETPTPTVEVLGEDLNYKRKQEVQQELDSAKEAFRKATQGLSSFGQLQAIPEFVNLVKAYAKFGVVRIDEAVQFIKEAIGDKIKNFSDQDIQIAIEKTVKKIKEAESKEVKKAVSKTINKSVSSNIEGKVSNKDISKKLEKAIYDFGVAVGQEKAGEKVTKLEDKIKFKKELQNQVDQLLKDKDFRNHINNSDATITAVANKARKINTQKQLDNFVDYLNKLAEDGKYNEKIERAKSNNIDGLLTKSAKKTVPFDLFNSLKELSRIGKKLVSLSIQDLEDYTRIVEQIKRNGIKPTIKDGIISYGNVSQSEIDSFLDRVVKEEDKSVFKNPMLDEIKRLDSKYGSIDVTLDTEDPNTGLTSSRAFKSFEELGLAQIKGEITTDQYIDAINKVLKEFKDIIDNRGNDLKVELRNYVDSIGYDNFSDSEKEVIKDLMNTDPKLLNEGESLLFTNVLTNIIDNNNFNGSRVISDIGAATKKIKSLEKISDLVRKNIKGRWYVERFFSKPMILDAMTKTLKASRELSKYTNFDNIMNKSAEAKTKWQQYIKRYNDIIKKYKKKGIDLNSAESDYRRGIINNVFQFLNHESNIAAMDKEFQERLLDVVSDIEKHRKAQDDKSVIGKENKFKADLIEKALNSLGINSNMGFKEAYDIISKKYPGEVELVEESKRTFADNLEMFKANTEIGNNKQFKEYYNYGPTKVHNTNRKESDIAESGKTTFTKESLSRKQVGSSIARTGKGDTSVWDYNFDNISSRVLLEQLLDSHIQRETIITQKILDSDEAKEIIGADNIEIIKNAIIDKLNEDYYTTPVDNAVNKDIGKFFLGLNKRYVQVLLGSANQFLKQYVGVITDAMFQVGLNNWSKAVVVSVKKAETTKRLLDRFPIGERLRETPAFSYDISDKELERSTIDVRNPLTKLVSKTLEAEGNLNKSWGEGIMYSLKWADNRAAVHTWLAAYGKYIIDEKNKKQQVRYSAIPFKFEDIDWEAEASNSNQDAANYAEQVVSRTQYISDPSLGAKALKSRNIGDVIIKSMLFPLATFTINNKNRIITDIANVRTDKGAKGRIAGYIAGIAMYNAGLLGLKEMGEAAAESIAESLGFSGDKDDEDDSKKFEKWWKDVVMEMTFGGIEIPEVTLKYMINTAASFYKAEEIERAEADLINAQREDEKERLIDEYSETITPEEEEKGITPEDKYKNHIADLKKHVGDKKEPIYDFYTRNIGRGNTTLISEIAEKILKKINKVDDIDDTDLTVSEQNKYSNAFITLSVLEGLSVVGWSEGTINSLAKKIEKNVKESLKKDIKTAKENKERKRIEEDEQQ
jgi:hypothetical protein